MLPCGVVTPWPERVVATITTLVLPPYSAGGAPDITSIDCTESRGIWFENTLLCWSVIGWPSTENEFSAWSPSPWKRPLESAATPGDVCVTSALTDDDALSSGTSLSGARSTSVCDVEPVSSRSPAASTTTVLLLPASWRLIFRLIGTDD